MKAHNPSIRVSGCDVVFHLFAFFLALRDKVLSCFQQKPKGAWARGSQKLTYIWIFFMQSQKVIYREMRAVIILVDVTSHIYSNFHSIIKNFIEDFYHCWIQEININNMTSIITCCWPPSADRVCWPFSQCIEMNEYIIAYPIVWQNGKVPSLANHYHYTKELAAILWFPLKGEAAKSTSICRQVGKYLGGPTINI